MLLEEYGKVILDFLSCLLGMSMQASIVILVVLVLRGIFGKINISKKYVMLLWVIPFICLIFPWRFSSPIGVWGNSPTEYNEFAYGVVRGIGNGIEDAIINTDSENKNSVDVSAGETGNLTNTIDGTDANGNLVNSNEQTGQIEDGINVNFADTGNDANVDYGLPIFEDSGECTDDASGEIHITFNESKRNLSYLIRVGVVFGVPLLWSVGVVGLYLYSLMNLGLLKVKLRKRIPIREGIYMVDRLPVPMVVGIFNPKIYLPSGIEKEHLEYVIAHEQTHIRRKDMLSKVLAYFVTCLHWFNPLVWLAYNLMVKDIEMACDEETVSRLGIEKKKDYATALLLVAAGKRNIFAVPLAFKEGSTRSRIMNILKYKKTKKILAVGVLVLCVLLAVLFLTKGEGVLGKGNISNETNTQVNDIDTKSEAVIKKAGEIELTTEVEKFTVWPSDTILKQENEEIFEGFSLAEYKAKETAYPVLYNDDISLIFMEESVTLVDQKTQEVVDIDLQGQLPSGLCITDGKAYCEMMDMNTNFYEDVVIVHETDYLFNLREICVIDIREKKVVPIENGEKDFESYEPNMELVAKFVSEDGELERIVVAYNGHGSYPYKHVIDMTNINIAPSEILKSHVLEECYYSWKDDKICAVKDVGIETTDGKRVVLAQITYEYEYSLVRRCLVPNMATAEFEWLDEYSGESVPQPGYIIDAGVPDEELTLMQKVLLNKAEFYGATEYGDENPRSWHKVEDFEFFWYFGRNSYKYFCVVDLDRDGKDEVCVSYDSGHILILHEEDGEIYGYIDAYRGMAPIYENGTAQGSGGASRWYLYGDISFEGNVYSKEVLLSIDSFTKEVKFYKDGYPNEGTLISEEEFDRLMEEYDAEESEEYMLTVENILKYVP